MGLAIVQGLELPASEEAARAPDCRVKLVDGAINRANQVHLQEFAQ